MNSFKWLCAALALSALSLPACGGDDKKNSPNPDAQAYLTSCQNLCVKQDTAKCTSVVTMTLADCKSLCDALSQAIPGTCAAKYKAYGQCTDNASDACTAETACSTQMEAANTCQ